MNDIRNPDEYSLLKMIQNGAKVRETNPETTRLEYNEQDINIPTRDIISITGRGNQGYNSIGGSTALGLGMITNRYEIRTQKGPSYGAELSQFGEEHDYRTYEENLEKDKEKKDPIRWIV